MIHRGGEAGQNLSILLGSDPNPCDLELDPIASCSFPAQNGKPCHTMVEDTTISVAKLETWGNLSHTTELPSSSVEK